MVIVIVPAHCWLPGRVSKRANRRPTPHSHDNNGGTTNTPQKLLRDDVMSPLPLTRGRLLPVRQLPSLWLQRHRWCHGSDVALRDYDCRRRRRGHHLSCGCEQPIKAVHIIQAGQ